MKNCISALALFLSFAAAAQSPSIQQAEATAKADHKLILVTFSGSDWCIPCIRMEKEVFEQDAFKKYAAEHLVVLNADFPRLKKHQLPADQQKQNEALAEAYNKKGSFPLTVLLDADGHVLKEWEGVAADSPENFIAQIETVPYAR